MSTEWRNLSSSDFKVRLMFYCMLWRGDNVIMAPWKPIKAEAKGVKRTLKILNLIRLMVEPFLFQMVT